jgi:hypothetical protein
LMSLLRKPLLTHFLAPADCKSCDRRRCSAARRRLRQQIPSCR